MTRTILNRLTVVAGAFFLAVCWAYAAVGVFNILTHAGHPTRTPIHFCEGER